MIPDSYEIHLELVGVRWHWLVIDPTENPDECVEAMGDSQDYATACADALSAFDTLRAKDMGETL